MQTPSLVIACVLDESGSMYSQTQQTISGINQYISDLKKENKDKNVLFSLTKFATKSSVVYAAESLEKVDHLDASAYKPNGGTALFDAVGETILEIEQRTNTETPVLIIILTDGEENSSCEHTLTDIQQMIKSKKESGWSFVFLGSGEEAWTTGQTLGADAALNFNAQDMKSTMESISQGTMQYSSCRAAGLSSVQASDQFAQAYSKSRSFDMNSKLGDVDEAEDKI